VLCDQGLAESVMHQWAHRLGLPRHGRDGPSLPCPLPEPTSNAAAADAAADAFLLNDSDTVSNNKLCACVCVNTCCLAHHFARK